MGEVQPPPDSATFHQSPVRTGSLACALARLANNIAEANKMDRMKCMGTPEVRLSFVLPWQGTDHSLNKPNVGKLCRSLEWL